MEKRPQIVHVHEHVPDVLARRITRRGDAIKKDD
jgi:hypothetical protein